MHYLPIFVFMGYVWSAKPFTRLQPLISSGTEPSGNDSHDNESIFGLVNSDVGVHKSKSLSKPVLNGTWNSPLRHDKLPNLSEADQPEPAMPKLEQSPTSAVPSQSSHSSTPKEYNIQFIEKAFDLIYKHFGLLSVLEIANDLRGEQKSRLRLTQSKVQLPRVKQRTLPTRPMETPSLRFAHRKPLRNSSSATALGTPKHFNTEIPDNDFRKCVQPLYCPSRAKTAPTSNPFLDLMGISSLLPLILRVEQIDSRSSGIVEVEILPNEKLIDRQDSKGVKRYRSLAGFSSSLLDGIGNAQPLVRLQAYFKPSRHDNWFLWDDEGGHVAKLSGFGAPVAQMDSYLVYRHKLDPRFYYHLLAEIEVRFLGSFDLSFTGEADLKKLGFYHPRTKGLTQHLHLPNGTGKFGLADGLTSGVRHDEPLTKSDHLVLPFKRPWWCPPSDQTGMEIIYSNSKDILCLALPGRVLLYTAWIHLDVAYNFIISAKDRTQLIIDLGRNVGDQKEVFTLEAAGGSLTTGVLDKAPGYYQATVKTWVARSKPTFFITMCDVKNPLATKPVTFHQFPGTL